MQTLLWGSRRHAGRMAAVAALLWSLAGLSLAQTIILSSTTSTEQSGLFAYLLPEFKKATGIDIKVVALGTGQALDMARRGDADVVFVHESGGGERHAWKPVALDDLLVRCQ